MYNDVCNKIEKDKNFGTKLTQHQLKHMAKTSLNFADTPITLGAQAREYNEGKLYSALKASYEIDLEEGKFYWSVSTTQILVNLDGTVSFYGRGDLGFTNPLKDISLDDFLGKSVLISETEKKAANPRSFGITL